MAGSHRWGLVRFLGAFFAVFALVVSGCASKPATVERTEGYDFAGVQTYAWVTEELILIEFGEDQPRVRTKDNEKRVRAAVDRELQSRGLTKVPLADADVMVAFSVGVRMAYRLEGGDRTSLVTDGPSRKQTQGTLNLYVLDRADQKEVWHGSMSKWLDPSDDPDVVINQAVGKILALYP